MVGMWVSGLWRLEEGLLCFRLIIKETTETAFYLLLLALMLIGIAPNHSAVIRSEALY